MAPKKIWIRVIPREEKELHDLVKKVQLPVNIMINLLTDAKDVYDLAAKMVGVTVPGSKTRYRLMFNQLLDGSRTLELEPTASTQAELFEAGGYADPVVTAFSGYFETLNTDDEAAARDGINTELKNPEDKTILLSRAWGLWAREEFGVEIITGETKETGEVLALKESCRPRIKRLLEEENRRLPAEIEGVITRLRLDGKPSYGIKTIDGKIIKSTLPSEDRERIIELLESPVRIRGTIQGKRGSLELKKIDEILPIDVKTYSTLGEFPFPKPLELDFSFEDDFFILKNESLGIRAWGTTKIELERSLLEELLYLKEAFVDESDSKLSLDAKQL